MSATAAPKTAPRKTPAIKAPAKPRYVPPPQIHGLKPIILEEGESPFGAVSAEFAVRLLKVVQHYASTLLNEWPHMVPQRDHTYIEVPNVLTHFTTEPTSDGGKRRRYHANSIRVVFPDESTRDFTADVAHYGPRVDEVYTTRGWGVYKKLDKRPAFWFVQKTLLEETGACFVDFSYFDEKKGHPVYDFRIYRTFDDLPELEKTWHGFNRVFLPKSMRDAASTTDADGFTAVSGSGGGSGGAVVVATATATSDDAGEDEADEDDGDADILRLARLQK